MSPVLFDPFRVSKRMRKDKLAPTIQFELSSFRTPQLSWVYGAKDNDYRLAAVSGDGKVSITADAPERQFKSRSRRGRRRRIR